MNPIKVFDLHCDTMLKLFFHQSHEIRKNNFHIDIEKLKKGQSYVQCFALFDFKDKSNYEMDFLKKYIDFYKQIMSENEEFNPITKISDVKENKLNTILTMEDAGSMQGKIENLEYVYEQGVRMIALLWNYENAYGYPNSDNAVIMQSGLKPAGIETIRKMNELGMLVDVSHMSYGCFYDVAKYSNQPFVASHSCMETLNHHKRNLTDEMLKKIAASGGVCGINFCSEFINGSKDYMSVDDIVTQALYMKNIAGIDSISLGSDFDGISNALEMVDFSGMQLIVQKLDKAGFSINEIEKIMYRNAMRVFSQICG